MRDGLLALLGVAAASGCSYDWAVVQGADAAGDVVSMTDAAAGKDGTIDAPLDVVADTFAKPDAPDALPEAASLPPCNASQESMVQEARAAALVCTGITPNPCMVLVTDECGCPVVAAAENQAEASYVTAIKQLATTCIPSCPSGCGTAPTEGLCLVFDAGAGAYACVQ